MCMNPQEVKETCQEVISFIGKTTVANRKVVSKGCPGCQGEIQEHSVSCINASKVVTQLGKKLLKLQRQLNGIICYEYPPNGRKFVIDLDALNHSFS